MTINQQNTNVKKLYKKRKGKGREQGNSTKNTDKAYNERERKITSERSIRYSFCQKRPRSESPYRKTTQKRWDKHIHLPHLSL